MNEFIRFIKENLSIEFTNAEIIIQENELYNTLTVALYFKKSKISFFKNYPIFELKQLKEEKRVSLIINDILQEVSKKL